MTGGPRPGARRVRDVARADVYLAEELAFDGTVVAERPGGEALAAAVRRLLASPWWRQTVGDPGVVRRVTVRPGTDSHWAAGTGTVALDPGEPWYVVTHELAHVAVSGAAPPSTPGAPAAPGTSPESPVPAGEPTRHGAAHGPWWRGWNVVLVVAAFGPSFGALLADSFARCAMPVSLPTSGSSPPAVSPPVARPAGTRPSEAVTPSAVMPSAVTRSGVPSGAATPGVPAAPLLDVVPPAAVRGGWRPAGRVRWRGG